MTGEAPLVVAIDAGTTGGRACAVDLEGRVVAERRHGYRIDTPRPGWAEQDPAEWRDSALRSLADLAKALPDPSRIEAIGLTGQCPTVAPIDAGGNPVGPGLLYRDNRATLEAEQMRDRIGEETMHRITGHVAEAFHVGPKILWWRRHEPDLFAAARWFMQPRDVVGHALTGEFATDQTHANVTLLYNLREREWDGSLPGRFDLDPGRFPTVLAPWEQAGTLAPEVAELTGIPAGRPVVIGSADSQCAAYGSGLAEPGAISEMAGASSCLNSVVLEPLADLRITHYSHVVPDRYSTELGVNTTGAAVDWAVSSLGFEGYEEFGAAASRARASLNGGGGDPTESAPLFLPYLGDGERDDPGIRGAFVGLSDRHGRDRLAYSVLEGIAFAVRETIAVLVEAGSPCQELRVAGGGARMEALGRLKADLLGVPVLHLNADTAPIGAARLAAESCDLAFAGHPSERAARFEPERERAPLLERLEWFRSARSSQALRLPDSKSRPEA